MKYLKERAKDSNLKVKRQKNLFGHTGDEKAWKFVRKKKRKKREEDAVYTFIDSSMSEEFDEKD